MEENIPVQSLSQSDIVVNPQDTNIKKLRIAKKKVFLGAIFLLILILIISMIMVFVNKYGQQSSKVSLNHINQNSVNQNNNVMLKSENLAIKNALISNFGASKFDIKNLTSPGSLLNVAHYKNSLYLLTTTGILEIDSSTQQVIKQNAVDYQDPENIKPLNNIDCRLWSVLIDNKLFFSCGVLGIYGIDLDKNEVFKRYSLKNEYPLNSDRHNMVNPTFDAAILTSKGNELWGYSWTGVFRINITNDKFEYYKGKTFGVPDHCKGSWEIHTDTNNVFMLSPTANVFDCPGVISVYKPNSDSWKNYPISNLSNITTDETAPASSIPAVQVIAHSKDRTYFQYTLKGNKTLRLITYENGAWKTVAEGSSGDLVNHIKNTDPDAVTPPISTINNAFNYLDQATGKMAQFVSQVPTCYVGTPLTNGKYYLLCDKGVYTIEGSSFPKLLVSAKIEANFINGKYYLTNNGKYILAAGFGGTQSGWEGPWVNLIDLATGKTIETYYGTSYYRDFSLIDKYKNFDILSEFNNSHIVQTENKIDFVDNKDYVFMSLDLQSLKTEVFPK